MATISDKTAVGNPLTVETAQVLGKSIGPEVRSFAQRMHGNARAMEEAVKSVQRQIDNGTVSVVSLSCLNIKHIGNLAGLQSLEETVNKVIRVLAGNGCFSWFWKWYYSLSFRESFKLIASARQAIISAGDLNRERQKLIVDGADDIWEKTLADYKPQIEALSQKIQTCKAKAPRVGDRDSLQQELDGYHDEVEEVWREVAARGNQLLEQLGRNGSGGDYAGYKEDLKSRIRSDMNELETDIVILLQPLPY